MLSCNLLGQLAMSTIASWPIESKVSPVLDENTDGIRHYIILNY